MSFWGIQFNFHFSKELSQLRKLENDGLLTISDASIDIEARGRCLIRDICIVFDHYLEQSDNNNRYSRLV